MALIKPQTKFDSLKIKPTSEWMELVLSDFFGIRSNTIVPRVSWGLNGEYEKDLVIVRKSGWAIEIEIKISKADVKKDLTKNHTHDSKLMKELYFAIPDTLYNDSVIDMIPEKAGIIVVKTTARSANTPENSIQGFRANIVRQAKQNKQSRKLLEEEIKQVMRLGNLRYWSRSQKSYKKELLNEKI